MPSIAPVLMFAAVTGVIAAIQYFTEAAVASSVASGKAVVGEGISNNLGYPDAKINPKPHGNKPQVTIPTS